MYNVLSKLSNPKILTLFLLFQLNEISQTDNKVKSMMELVFDITKDKEKREKGSANLVVLARER